MKASVGYTVILNIIIIFITIIVAFLCAALVYFKSNKVSNVITSAIEKYEGYTTDAVNEINRNLTSLGYGSHSISCGAVTDDSADKCELKSDGSRGYCVYICYEEDKYDPVSSEYQGEYYFYKIRTNMMINIPIINDILDIPIYSNTIRLYNFKKV